MILYIIFYPFDKVNKLIEKNIIEIVPLAYMRGRTLRKRFYNS